MNVSVGPQVSNTTTNLTIGNETELISNDTMGPIMGASSTMEIVYVAIGAIGTIGNATVLIVMLSLKYLCSKTTNKFIINQSFIDLLTSLVIIITYLLHGIIPVPEGVAGRFVCFVLQTYYLVWALVLISTYNLVAMTLEKYIAVMYPFKHKYIFTDGKIKIIFGLTWLVGPSFYSVFFTTTNYRDGICYMFDTWMDNGTQLWPVGRMVFSYGTIVVMWYIPITIMSICYGRMAWFLHSNTNLTVGLSTDMRRLKMIQARRNIVKTLLLVAILHVICTTPKQLFDFLYLSGVPLSFQGYFFNLSNAVIFCNCAINPLLYSIQFQDFKKGAVKLFCCKPAQQD